MKWQVFSLYEFHFHSSNDVYLTIAVEIGPVVLEKKIKSHPCIFRILILSPHEHGSSIQLIRVSFTLVCFVPNLVKIVPDFLKVVLILFLL